MAAVPDTEGRIRRLLAVVPYVLKHQGVTLGELCEVFGVSREQIISDLNLIFICGQPDYTPADLIDVTIDGDSVTIRMADYFARPMRFTAAELAGLHMACEAVANLSGLPESSALNSAMGRIAGALKGEAIPWEMVVDRVKIRPLTPWLELVAALSRACTQRRVVEMEYYTYGRDDFSRRRVHPLSLDFGMGNWYLRAWDGRSGEVRVFRVDRIKDMSVSGEGFEPPPGEEGEGPPQLYEPAASGEIEVRLRFSPALARWAEEQPVFSRKEAVEGGLLCSMHTENLSWVERELLKYGAEVEVLSPPELKDGLRARVEKLLGKYV